jgi:hypothetical protein
VRRASLSPVSHGTPITRYAAWWSTSCVALGLAACDAKPSTDHAGPVASVSAAPLGSIEATASPSLAPSARIAHWDDARASALHIPCRAIAVDGHVHAEASDFGPMSDAGATPGPVALAPQGEIPDGAWISVMADSRLVAKDPRTTRETTFIGPARVRACVDHREESWLASGRFESSMGAGETPGAEEWVVTGLGVVRYMAAKASVDVQAADGAVQVANGVAFLWLPDDVGIVTPAAAKAGDAAAAPGLDDDGWLRMGEGTAKLTRRAPLDAFVRARRAVEQCVSLTRRAQDLAAALFAGTGSMDAGTAKDQVRTRRLGRAACDVADLRVDILPPSAPRGEMSARLEDSGVPMQVPVPFASPGSPPSASPAPPPVAPPPGATP